MRLCNATILNSLNNLKIDYRWTTDDARRLHQCAAELVAPGLDVIVTAGSSHISALQKITRTVHRICAGRRRATDLANFEFDSSGK